MSLISLLLVGQSVGLTATPQSVVVCARLQTDWKVFEQNASARMVSNFGVTDDLRLVRQSYDLVEQLQSHTTLELMKLNGCVLPSRAVLPYRFAKAAAACDLARSPSQSVEPQECDRAKWQPNE